MKIISFEIIIFFFPYKNFLIRSLFKISILFEQEKETKKNWFIYHVLSFSSFSKCQNIFDHHHHRLNFKYLFVARLEMMRFLSLQFYKK